MSNPFELLSLWIVQERQQGAPNPQQAILATATEDSIPHSRVVAIREIKKQQLIFFTQNNTRKFLELMKNPATSMTFWFELSQREVMLDGTTVPLSAEENNLYWQDYPREAQIRFYSYAATSSQPIMDKLQLENKRKIITADYQNKQLPLNPFYAGFKFTPKRIVFYSYRLDELSDVFEYSYAENQWQQQLLSP